MDALAAPRLNTHCVGVLAWLWAALASPPVSKIEWSWEMLLATRLRLIVLFFTAGTGHSQE